jgi:hypothetical protein
MKIRPVGAEMFRADGQTDKTKLIVAFRNLANAAKKLGRTGKQLIGERRKLHGEELKRFSVFYQCS